MSFMVENEDPAATAVLVEEDATEAPGATRYEQPPTDLPQVSETHVAVQTNRRGPSLPAPTELTSKLARVEEPEPHQWWRRLFRMGPDAETLAAQDRSWAMQANFGEPITIMVASPKGSSGKTPTARCLGAAFANARGGGVVVMDNNELRGTLSTRSVVTHDGNLGDVLRSADYFLSRDASVLALQRAMHRQPDSHEWILGSDTYAQAPLSGMQYDTIHSVLEHFFELIIVDTGNNEQANNWIAAARSTDLLVVPLKWRRDHTAPAAQMLANLDRRKPGILSRTVIVATNGPGDANAAERAEGLEYFSSLPIIEIPTDPALQAPTISWPRLRPGTRKAYESLAVQLCDLAINRE